MDAAQFAPFIINILTAIFRGFVGVQLDTRTKRK
jgi:hypothetical protein